MTVRLMTLAALAAIALGATGEGNVDPYRKVLDPMVAAINSGDYEAIRKDFNAQMADALSLEQTRESFSGLRAQYGKITKVGPGRREFPAMVFPAQFERGRLNIKLVLDGQGKVAGLWFLPAPPEIPVPQKHQATLHLPFQGDWNVLWGGDTAEQNQHHEVPNQRYAFDFIAVGADGSDHRGTGDKNEDFYAFGKEILSPAEGVVTDVINGVRDNTPGSMNPYSALGNAVIIQHGEHEFSVLAHLKLNSITVKVGQKLTAGQVIGLCGNSGNSSQPHLHYHLQNTPIIQDGTGIKCLFDGVSVRKDGTHQTQGRYSPVRGDIVSPAGGQEEPAGTAMPTSAPVGPARPAAQPGPSYR
ncbi:MAG: peptidoglycan DD-metalloendopeptidase family protein [Phycisphaerae bacterium]|nr:peptidoglycan DD-metalloendopeptidase family protein [Phycisphaerae bacterium]